MCYFKMIVEKTFVVGNYVVAVGKIEKGKIEIDDWVSITNPKYNTYRRSRIVKIECSNQNPKDIALFLITGWGFDQTTCSPGSIIMDTTSYHGWD